MQTIRIRLRIKLSEYTSDPITETILKFLKEFKTHNVYQVMRRVNMGFEA